MATIVQAPTFAADPNAVPETDPFGNIMRGYQLSQLPAKMKAERLKAQADLQHSQDVNRFYPLAQQQGLDLGAQNIESKRIANEAAPGLNQALLNQRNAQTGLTEQQAALYRPYTQSQINKNNAEAANAGQGSNGISISGYDEQGRPLIQVGGSKGTGNTRYGGQLVVDADGNVSVMPTKAVQTAIQNRQVGEDVASPFIEQIVSNLPQFQTATKRAQSSVSGAANQLGLSGFIDSNPYAQMFGLSSALPSQKATGEAALTSAAEGLLKASALNNTGENFTKVRAAIEPRAGESAAGYSRRIHDYFGTISKNTAEAQRRNATGFATGINTNGPVAPPNPALSSLSDEQLAAIANGGQ